MCLPALSSAAERHTDAGPLLGSALSDMVSIIAYAALFVMPGVRFRRALPWGLAYILIWEGFVASAGAGAARLAVRTYARSILAELADVRIRHAGYALGTGIVVPIIIAVVALTYASYRLARTDVA